MTTMPRSGRMLPQRFPIPKGFSPATRNLREEEWKAWQTRRAPNGPYPEFIVYDWLEKKGYQEHQDFWYQLPIGGGRTGLSGTGGFVIDFMFEASISGTRLPAEVYGSAFHTDAVFINPAEQAAADKLKKVLMLQQFGRVVYIGEAEVLGNTEQTMLAAIAGYGVEGP